MKFPKGLVLGYNAFPYKSNELFPNASYDAKLEYFSSKLNPYGRLLLNLLQYLQENRKYSDRINVVLTYEQDIVWPNGTLEGLLKQINHSEIDVGVTPLTIDKRITDAVDFAYPYKLEDYTFITRKPEYKPHIFGIFQMFSLSVWLTIILMLIAISILSYSILKKKYTFIKVCFDVLAILMKQNSSIKTSSLMEKLLVYSWVVGAMILCLSYDSVFLSFLLVPPLLKIKHLSDLASAVENGDYHSISYPHMAFYWKDSEHEHLQVIAKDILKNKLSYGSAFTNFLRESKKQNLAFIINTKFLHALGGKFFVSEDRFNERMPAMTVRRGFCCKELLDTFVHRIMASGIYNKYASDGSFLASMGWRSEIPDYETTNKKLTLTDVAPAFIFLLTGCFISFLVLIYEMYSSKKMIYIKKNPKIKRRKIYDGTFV